MPFPTSRRTAEQIAEATARQLAVRTEDLGPVPSDESSAGPDDRSVHSIMSSLVTDETPSSPSPETVKSEPPSVQTPPPDKKRKETEKEALQPVCLPVAGTVTQEYLESEIASSRSTFGDRMEKIKLLRSLSNIEIRRFHAAVPSHLHADLKDAFAYHLNVAASASEVGRHLANLFLLLERSVHALIGQGKAVDESVLIHIEIHPLVERVWSYGVETKRYLLRRHRAKKRTYSKTGTADDGIKKKLSGVGHERTPANKLVHDLLLPPESTTKYLEEKVLDVIRTILLDEKEDGKDKATAGAVYRILKGPDRSMKDLAHELLNDLYIKDNRCDPRACMEAVAYVCGVHNIYTSKTTGLTPGRVWKL